MHSHKLLNDHEQCNETYCCHKCFHIYRRWLKDYQLMYQNFEKSLESKEKNVFWGSAKARSILIQSDIVLFKEMVLTSTT